MRRLLFLRPKLNRGCSVSNSAKSYDLSGLGSGPQSKLAVSYLQLLAKVSFAEAQPAHNFLARPRAEGHEDVSLTSFDLVAPVAEVDDAGGRTGADARLGCTMFYCMERSHICVRIT